MIPVAFDQENAVTDAHPTAPGRYDPIPVRVDKDEDGTICIASCWKMTKMEQEEFLRTGRIWLVVQGEVMPYCYMTACLPFTDLERGDK